MGPFLETFIGGLMTGMLYSLVALGFVLIFKASGVFNFAQGAMVLFAALAMARFAEWIPALLGIEHKALVNLMAFILAMGVMVMLAWVVERFVLGKLVNQEGVTLLMATLGITYFMDGFKLGVQFSLSQVALKALPVVILGGLTSVPGAIVGGLIIGVGEKLSEVYIGPMLGGGIEIWFAYALALLFLLVRPQGLYGEKIIDRV
ncbi:MAG: hypothetical protein EBS73_13315 [Betaproteobacteria bacterium]|nr:hypothetical protein [Betaproteobacteria bacterium]